PPDPRHRLAPPAAANRAVRAPPAAYPLPCSLLASQRPAPPADHPHAPQNLNTAQPPQLPPPPSASACSSLFPVSPELFLSIPAIHRTCNVVYPATRQWSFRSSASASQASSSRASPRS